MSSDNSFTSHSKCVEHLFYISHLQQPTHPGKNPHILPFFCFSFPLSLFSTHPKRKQELLDWLIIHRDKQTRKKKKKRAKDQKSDRYLFGIIWWYTLWKKKKRHLRVISIKKQQLYVPFELLCLPRLFCPFGTVFHFCHMRIPAESPLINVTRVILEQNEVRGSWEMKSGSDN